MGKLVSASAFVAFLKERLAAKDGYIMCATGQDPQKLSDWWFSGQYSGSQLKKALYWKEHAARVWDCNGLSEGYYKDQTGIDINTRARYNYSEWCSPKGTGTIPAAYRVPGAAVFKKSSYIHHVGYLIEPVTPGKPSGDWYIIEAKGVMYGVIRSKLSDGGWNCWGLMTKYYDYESTDTGEPIGEPNLGDRLLKRGCVGGDVEYLQTLLAKYGYDIGKYGCDGEYGDDTARAVKMLQHTIGVATDGEYGEKTHEAFMNFIDHEEDPSSEDTPPSNVNHSIEVTAAVSAYVRLGAGTEYGIITSVKRGTQFEYSAVADNGWYCISVNGKIGWISPKMTRSI